MPRISGDRTSTMFCRTPDLWPISTLGSGADGQQPAIVGSVVLKATGKEPDSWLFSPEHGGARRVHQDRNFNPAVILSMILRSPWIPSPTRSSAAVGVAATLARLSASLVVLNSGSV